MCSSDLFPSHDTGYRATKTATTFKEKIGIDGVILSKYDGDTKGG